MNQPLRCSLIGLTILMVWVGPALADFVHPGLLHSRADLQHMHDEVQAGLEPWASGFAVFKADPASQLDYRMRGPGAEIGRNPSVNFDAFDQDANASYQLALMWVITRDKAYADKALKIINAWSRTLKRFDSRVNTRSSACRKTPMVTRNTVRRVSIIASSPAGFSRGANGL